jgi:hypothetical protein
MIRKFLIVGKQEMLLSSAKLENERQSLYHIDLLLPLDVYWQIAALLQKAQYLLASDEEMADIHEIYKGIFRKAALYAVFETDRLWLLQNGQQKTMGAS